MPRSSLPLPPQLLLLLLPQLLSLLLLLAPVSLVRAGISPDNPAGIHLTYSLAWLNTATGNFGGNLTIQQLAPATPPLPFSLKFYFDRPDTLVQDYWGDWRITHYQSGAYHVQPGAAVEEPRNATRIYLFNGIYNTTLPGGGNATAAMPSAIALLQGANYTDNEVAFQRDDIRVVTQTAGLPQAPFGSFLRGRQGTNAPTAGGSDVKGAGDATADQKAAAGGDPLSGNTAYFIGGGVAAAVLAAVVVGFVALKRRKSGQQQQQRSSSPSSKEEDGKGPGVMGGADVARKGSFRGMVNQGAVEPNVQLTSPVMVAGPITESGDHDHAGPASFGTGMPQPSFHANPHDSVSRQQQQLDFVEQYASNEFRDEMDDAIGHHSFATPMGGQQQQQHGYYASEANDDVETTSHSYSSQEMIGRIEEEERRLQSQLDSASHSQGAGPLRSRSPMLQLSGFDDDPSRDSRGDMEDSYAMAYEAVELDHATRTHAHAAPGPNYI